MALFSFVINNICLLPNNSHNKVMLYYRKLRSYRKAFQHVPSVSTTMYNACFKREVSTHKFLPFDAILQNRRDEAKRTLVIEIQNKNVMSSLVDYCSQYGDIKNVHHFIIKKDWQHALVEFESQESISALLEYASYSETESAMPTNSNFLWFKNNVITKVKPKPNKPKEYIAWIHFNSNFSEKEVNNRLLTSCNSISEQIQLLYNCFQLTDTEIRLRFITANQLEKSLSCLFPHLKVLPFGSSINGFGKHGCDLDLVMNFNDISLQSKRESHFYFQTKSLNDERSKIQTCMETISGHIKYFVPGAANVRKILKARVPIIKYTHEFTGLDCDVSMSNMTAIYMSELLYLFGEIDNRVRPLVFTIRNWAQKLTLTRSDPGLSITNFSLTLLVIYFLQTKKIIPTLNYLQDISGKDDIRKADCHIDCTFLRDLNKLQMKRENMESLESLLNDFFRFYMDFDFIKHAISIRTGKVQKKSDFSPLYICNPLETTLNVSRNVSIEEVHRLIIACANSSEVLHSMKERKHKKDEGLLNIFNSSKVAFAKKSTIANNINIKDLFVKETSEKKSVNSKLNVVQGRVKSS